MCEDEILCDCIDECCGLRIQKWDEQFLVKIYWHGGFHQHRSRWKALWAVIRGEPFHVMELVLSEEDALYMAQDITTAVLREKGCPLQEGPESCGEYGSCPGCGEEDE